VLVKIILKLLHLLLELLVHVLNFRGEHERANGKHDPDDETQQGKDITQNGSGQCEPATLFPGLLDLAECDVPENDSQDADEEGADERHNRQHVGLLRWRGGAGLSGRWRGRSRRCWWCWRNWGCWRSRRLVLRGRWGSALRESLGGLIVSYRLRLSGDLGCGWRH